MKRDDIDIGTSRSDPRAPGRKLALNRETIRLLHLDRHQLADLVGGRGARCTSTTSQDPCPISCPVC